MATSPAGDLLADNQGSSKSDPQETGLLTTWMRPRTNLRLEAGSNSSDKE
jgi:hypothetical protein